jgi:hypothetical protein
MRQLNSHFRGIRGKARREDQDCRDSMLSTAIVDSDAKGNLLLLARLEQQLIKDRRFVKE